MRLLSTMTVLMLITAGAASTEPEARPRPTARPTAPMDEAVRRALSALGCVSGGNDEWLSCYLPAGQAACEAFKAQGQAIRCRAERGALSHQTPDELTREAMARLGCTEDAQHPTQWSCAKNAASGMAACRAFKAKGTVDDCRQER